MCYSARIQADYRRYVREWGADIDLKSFVELFWWKDDEFPVVGDEHRALHAHAEQLTDDALAPAFSALSDAQAQAFVNGTAAMHAKLG